MPDLGGQMHRLGALVAAFATIAFVFGCGSGGSDEPSAGRALTKSEFIKEAEALCSKGVAEKEEAFAAGLESGKGIKYASQAELKHFVKVVAVDPYSKVVAHLAALQPPQGDKAATELVQSYEEAIEKAEADPLGAMKQNPFLEANELAAAYGLRSCMF